MIFIFDLPYFLIPAFVISYWVYTLPITIFLEGIIIHWIYPISWSDSFITATAENVLVIVIIPILLFVLLITGIVDESYYNENFMESDRLQIITAVVGGVIITTIKLSLLAYASKLNIFKKKVLIMYIENILITGLVLWFIPWETLF